MISFGELAIIGGASYFLVGPNELPRLARSAGHLIGQVFRTAKSGQGLMSQFVKQNKLDELHRDFNEGVAELHALRDELKAEARNASPMYQLKSVLTSSTSQSSQSSSAAQFKNLSADQYTAAPSGVHHTSITAKQVNTDASFSRPSQPLRVPQPTTNGRTSYDTFDRASNMVLIQQHLAQAKYKDKLSTRTDNIKGGADFLTDVMFERALARHGMLQDIPPTASTKD